MHYPTAKANATEQKDVTDPTPNPSPSRGGEWLRKVQAKETTAQVVKFRRQQGIGPYILDFYCPGYRLGIELDGASHDYKYEYDEQRTEYLRQQGIRVLRFSNQQVFTSMQGVLAEIVRAANEVTDPTPNPSP